MEDGGKSGKSMNKRDKFLELIALSKKKPKPFDYILVWKFSRFARNQEEAITLKSMLKRNDIEVVSISEPLPEGPFGDLVERIIEWTDSYYLVNLSQEVRRGMKERISRGQHVVPPATGYSLIDGKYTPNSDAEYIKGIFKDYLDGMGLRALATKYGNLGLRTKRGNLPDNRFIEYALRNPIYIGKLRWSLEGRAVSTRHYDNPNIIVIDGNFTPIISQETFDAVQKKLDAQKRMYGKYQRSEQPTQFMLKGLVRCSNCNSTLVFSSSKEPSMQCHSYGRGTCKVSHHISLNKANKIVIEHLEAAVKSQDFNIVPDNLHREAPEVTNYRRLIENEYTKLDRIKTAYENGIDSLSEYKANKSKIMANIKKLEKGKLENDKPKFSVKQYAKKVSEVLKIIKDDKQTEETKNTALRTVIKTITFDKINNTLEIFFY